MVSEQVRSAIDGIHAAESVAYYAELRVQRDRWRLRLIALGFDDDQVTLDFAAMRARGEMSAEARAKVEAEMRRTMHPGFFRKPSKPNAA